jgi:hypothetical protein
MKRQIFHNVSSSDQSACAALGAGTLDSQEER